MVLLTVLHLKNYLNDMKTLKESLLTDIDDTLAYGDEWEKNLKGEIKEFLKAITTAKNYESLGFKNGRKTAFFVPNLLKQLGYDANHIDITISTIYNFRGYEVKDVDWKLNIWLTKHSDDNMEYINGGIYDNTVYMDYCEYNKWNDVVKGLIKAATKSLDTFKKFLDNMKKWNGQLVNKQILNEVVVI